MKIMKEMGRSGEDWARIKWVEEVIELEYFRFRPG